MPVTLDDLRRLAGSNLDEDLEEFSRYWRQVYTLRAVMEQPA